MIQFLKVIWILGTVAFLGFLVSKPIGSAECVNPYGPGARSDLACKILSDIMDDVDYHPQHDSLYSGDERAFNSSTSSNQTELFIAASAWTVSRIARNKFGKYHNKKIRFIGSVGSDPGVIAVAANSEYYSLTDLVSAVKSQESIVISGGNTGEPSHINVLKVLQSSGVGPDAIKYLPYKHSSKAVADIISNSTNAMSGSLSDIIGLLDGSDIRVLAVLTESRIGETPPEWVQSPGVGGGCCSKKKKTCCMTNFDLSDIPTAKEQGINVISSGWQGFYVPIGVSDEAYQSWSTAISTAAGSGEWEKQLNEVGLLPYVWTGSQFDSYINTEISEYRRITKDLIDNQ